MARTIVLLAIIAAGLLAGCHHNPYYNPALPHHTPDGFQNRYSQEPKPGFWSLIAWKWEAWWQGLPKEPEGGYHPVVLKPDAAALQARTVNPSVTWIGHATLLVQMGGLNILTDPHFGDRASPFDWIGPTRRVPPALTIEELPHIDLVVISHNHYDHLDRDTVVRLNAQPGAPPRFLVPLGNQPWFEGQGIRNVREMDWWETEEYRGVRAILVPVHHWSARTRFDTNETLWGGWVLGDAGFQFLFVGDTGYSRDFQDIRERLGPMDLAALPIGAYEPRWFMKSMHVNPEEAVRIHQDLGTRFSLAMHWGTFPLSDEPIDEPPRRLAEALRQAGIPPERFFVMRHGETRGIDTLLARDR
jgi:L-ascorbate metabolism protein UlaG (beta-lactamase superfamily)